MPKDLEVLVHVSAPISKKDDDNQSRLAQASIGFPVSNRIKLAKVSTQWRKKSPRQERSPSFEIIPNPNGPSSQSAGLPHNSSPKVSFNLDDYYIENDTEATAALESQILTSSITESLDSNIEHPADIPDIEQSPTSNPQSKTPSIPNNDNDDPDLTSPESLIISTLASIAPLPTTPSPKTFTNPPLFAIPPSVPVALASPSTSLFGPTETLTKLGTKLTKYYRPTSQTRKLSRKERGSWIVNTENWSEALQIDFFTVLARFIRSGACGYGVSAYRIAPSTSSQDHAPQGSAANFQSERTAWETRTLGTVQVFCFGEMVREVFSLMWIVSASRIRMAEAFWVDAKGKTIIKMA